MNNLPKNSSYLLHLRLAQNYKHNSNLVYRVQAYFCFFNKILFFSEFVEIGPQKLLKRESKLIMWNITAADKKQSSACMLNL